MFFTKLILKDFIPLTIISNIHEIELDFENNDIGWLSGKNGSGKSSTLDELSFFPAISSSYKKTGYKEVRGIHENSNYITITDFQE